MKTVRLSASVAAGFGLLALLGWALGLPILASLASNRIPMAPSAALLFVLYGIATILRARLPLGRGAHLAGVTITSAGAGIAALLLVLSVRGINPAVELLGFAPAGMVGEAPAGHLSPVAAICFLLASLSYLGSLPSSSSRPGRATAAGGPPSSCSRRAPSCSWPIFLAARSSTAVPSSRLRRRPASPSRPWGRPC